MSFHNHRWHGPGKIGNGYAHLERDGPVNEVSRGNVGTKENSYS